MVAVILFEVVLIGYNKMRTAYRRARALAFDQVCPEVRGAGLSFVNHLLILVVLLAVAIQVLETEPLLYVPYASWFQVGDALVGTLFCADLLLRLWAIGENERFRGLWGRLRYLSRPHAIIDLTAVLPFVIAPWVSFLAANDLAFLRILTAIGILLNARLGRLSSALAALRFAIASRWEDLLVSLVFALATMLATAVGLYLVEGRIQPDAFGSIPRALWWSVETLTTVGYGDVFPHSILGKLFAGLFALAGIGIIAIPTGILAAAFNDAFRREHSLPPVVIGESGAQSQGAGSGPSTEKTR